MKVRKMKVKRSELIKPSGRLSVRVKNEDLPLAELEIVSGEVSVRLKIQPVRSDFKIDGTASARLREICDRCLVPYEINVESAFELMITENDYQSDRTDGLNTYLFPHNQNEFDFGPAIQDALVLERPMKKICKEDCKGLCPSCGINLNSSKCDCQETEIDERWSVLKTIDFSNMED
ncbi:MAG: DUF177 domain-containing protein [Candidatus Marinimicrobia bacterium]|nr:DUF177 domain-containing protein [Candidatus Neomarinimicrobiota bacterium]MDP6593711.1 DUF177 domain-containing protein [Candidatus Neomarinimicrobiota bacterium]MDP6836388.1 DUF177 domain-containing protein [Candidatus Neomarinimicrobiota bacterium]MDP6966047.1 DUF177 domain-containing protein [Candidatus Neomarinimicrobiota bacterium]